MMFPLPVSRTFSARSLLAGVLVAFVAVVGCGPSGPSDVVTGKVSLNGQPVTGTVVFVAADGKTVEGVAGPDGNYMISNPPKGEVSIIVKAMPGMGGPGPAMPKDMTGKDAMGKTAGGMGQAVAPPGKYASQNNGLSKFTVTGGKQTHNIDLAP